VIGVGWEIGQRIVSTSDLHANRTDNRMQQLRVDGPLRTAQNMFKPAKHLFGIFEHGIQTKSREHLI
jgi:hypothetical protein